MVKNGFERPSKWLSLCKREVVCSFLGMLKLEGASRTSGSTILFGTFGGSNILWVTPLSQFQHNVLYYLYCVISWLLSLLHPTTIVPICPAVSRISCRVKWAVHIWCVTPWQGELRVAFAAVLKRPVAEVLIIVLPTSPAAAIENPMEGLQSC